MKLEIAAKDGADAEVAFAITPSNGFTLIAGKGPNAEIFRGTSNYKKIGIVPARVQFTCMFDFRPWSIAIATRADTANGIAKLTSEALGLAEKPLISPDVLSIELIFTRAGDPNALL